MLPGDTIIRKCFQCGTLVKEYTIDSGNTFGATFWTDGKFNAPMLPDYPLLVKCPGCRVLFWVDEQEEVGRCKPFEENSFQPEAEEYLIPTLEDYFSFMEEGKPDRGNEKYLRLRAWWAGNDRRRYRGPDGVSFEPAPLSAKEIANLEALEKMLDSSLDNERLMIAEIRRELGRFREASEILDEPFDKRYSKAVARLRQLVANGDRLVAEIEY